jgi:Alpha-2-macroglobulin bait region domain
LREEVQIEVSSTKEISQLFYQVTGSGSLITSGSVVFHTTTKYHLKFMPKYEMLPKSNVVIYYITSTGDAVSDTIDIEFENELRSQIDLSLSANQQKPGDSLTITVNGQPNSFVGLLGVDQSVSILKSGNDLSASSIFEDLEKYGENRKGKSYSKNFKDFQKSNSIIITNGKQTQDVAEYPPGSDEIYESIEHRADTERMRSGIGYAFTSGMSLQSGRYNKNKKVPKVHSRLNSMQSRPIEVRKIFPETWIFDSFELKSK